MKLSRADLRDKFEAYESEATYTTGNKSTHQMIAMADVDQALDEIMNKGDIIHIVSESSELANVKEERDQYKKLWKQSQRLKRELIEKYNLPISEAVLD